MGDISYATMAVIWSCRIQLWQITLCIGMFCTVFDIHIKLSRKNV
jgi:hypothetical protein